MMPWAAGRLQARLGNLARRRASLCAWGVVAAALFARAPPLLPHARRLCFLGGTWRLRCEHGRTHLVAMRTLEVPVEAAAPLLASDVVDQVANAAQRMVKSTSARIIHLRNQIKDPSEAEVWHSKGMSLTALPKNQWRRGLTEVEVQDYSSLDGNGLPLTRVVELDPKKDFQKNAEICFKQARKINNAIVKVTPLIEESEQQLQQWEADAARADRWRAECAAGGELTTVAKQDLLRLYEAMLDQGVIKRPKPPPPPPDPAEVARLAFKRKHGKDIDCFRSPNGHEVVAGRSSKMNEYVSLKLAKGDMMWFHTDNRIPGSHVLIRAPWDEIQDEDVEFAAKIAAYHSKAKEKMLVPVMYCRGHQVSKIRGAPTGQVTIKGNAYQTMVQPALPEEG
mmetsp:Transcript_90250/g.273956  ORF Transcript_90250/g.273956 Transcript_90250/m.273956 type:complete len:394 (+) Transcript_90250:1-1182(+)